MKKFSFKTMLVTLLFLSMVTLSSCGVNTPTPGGGLTPYVVVVTPTSDPAILTAQAQQTASDLSHTITTTTSINSTTTKNNSSTPTTSSNPGETVYTVEKGDTLRLISDKFGVDIASIIKLNNIQDADTLHIGQQLKIPAPKSKTPKP